MFVALVSDRKLRFQAETARPVACLIRHRDRVPNLYESAQPCSTTDAQIRLSSLSELKVQAFRDQ